MTYLKLREYYEDIYDKSTVEQCRFLHHLKLKLTDKDIEDAKLTPEESAKMQEVKGLWIDVVQEMAAFFAAAERFNKKEAWIEKMMVEDKTKEHILATAEPPSKAKCRKCSSLDLRIVSKDLWHGSKGKDNRVLFMFSCNGCKTKTALYDDGEEWIVEPTRCPLCNSERLTHIKSNEYEVLTLKYTCGRCDNVWEDVHVYGFSHVLPAAPSIRTMTQLLQRISLVKTMLLCYHILMRAMVFGDTASGKSTFAEGLGEVFDIPVIHLDKLMEQVGRDNREDINAHIHQEADKEEWVIDGNAFTKDPEYRIERADIVFAFDFTRFATILSHLARHRRIQSDKEQRLGSNSTELNLPYFIPYIFKVFPPRKKAVIEKATSMDKDIVIFNRKQQASEYLASITR